MSTTTTRPKQLFHVKVIKITAEDSPNVRFARAQQQKGIKPTDAMVYPGVLSWKEMQKRRKLWDAVRQTIGLDAEFWEGANALLFPPDWLARANRLQAGLNVTKRRLALGGGLDTAQGRDNTCWTAIDQYGIIEQVSMKTPDTNKIVGITIDFMRKHGLRPENMIIDRGNGGQNEADRLRAKRFNVRTVGFGERVAPLPKKSETTTKQKIEAMEKRYVFLNRRAQLYGEASILIDPTIEGIGFAIPATMEELLRQLSPMPNLTDDNGRMYLPPKDKKKPGDKSPTLREMLGCSPDEADSFVLAVHAMLHPYSHTRAPASASHKEIKGKYDKPTPDNPLGPHPLSSKRRPEGVTAKLRPYEGYKVR